MNVWEEMLDATRMLQCNKGQRLERAITSEEREGIWQDLQEDCRAGDHEAISQDFH
jgi:hypothetical protein